MTEHSDRTEWPYRVTIPIRFLYAVTLSVYLLTALDTGCTKWPPISPTSPDGDACPCAGNKRVRWQTTRVSAAARPVVPAHTHLLSSYVHGGRDLLRRHGPEHVVEGVGGFLA